ncbi:pyruvate-flavodoxin oxidoreductase [Winogradskyella sp. PG-2]|nr:pyruvate-flavodoxin oxidoreductase [Winogradskyella sp. PG-2]
MISDKVISKMMEKNKIDAHRNRALNPNNPSIKGTSQGSDVFFQSREAINSFYDSCPEIVQTQMDIFSILTGRRYRLFDYVGHPEAEHIIITMASSSETVEETINYLNAKGEKYGLIKVRLFRPFSTKYLLKALPSSCKSIAVLDRTKEPGSTAEPLCLDVAQSLFNAYQNNKIETLPRIIGGRYGLSSKDFTPAMVNAIFNNLKQEQSKNNFTIGIIDDVTHLSLPYDKRFEINKSAFQALFFEEDSHLDQSLSSLEKTLGNSKFNYVQSFKEIDYKKSESKQVKHMRIDSKPIKAPYLITNADFIACQNVLFADMDNALNNIQSKGTLLINSSLTSKIFWQSLSANVQGAIIEKKVKLYIVNLKNLKTHYRIGEASISAFDTCFLYLNNGYVYSNNLAQLCTKIISVNTSKQTNFNTISIENKSDFESTLLGKLLRGNEEILVGDLPIDGSYQTNTSIFNTTRTLKEKPDWNSESCIQFGAFSMACPQGALRIKVYENEYLDTKSIGFKSIASKDFDLMNYTIQINEDQCNACNNCIEACDVKTIKLKPHFNMENSDWKYFKSIPEFDRTKIDITKISQQQLQEPLFKYSTGDDGCGEAPYLKLLSQLFGDRLLVANATGASSIFFWDFTNDSLVEKPRRKRSCMVKLVI